MSNAAFETLAWPRRTRCSCVAATRNLISSALLDYAMLVCRVLAFQSRRDERREGERGASSARPPPPQQPRASIRRLLTATPSKQRRRMPATRPRLTAIRAPGRWQRLCASAGPPIGSVPAVLTAPMPSRSLIGWTAATTPRQARLNILWTLPPEHRPPTTTATSAYACRPLQIRPCAPLGLSHSPPAAPAPAPPAPAPAAAPAHLKLSLRLNSRGPCAAPSSQFSSRYYPSSALSSAG